MNKMKTNPPSKEEEKKESVCGLCHNPFRGETYCPHSPKEIKEEAGSTMECSKCHRTSVVVNLNDKCPFCGKKAGVVIYAGKSY